MSHQSYHKEGGQAMEKLISWKRSEH